MKVPFVTLKPLESELDKELKMAFERVYNASFYIHGGEDKAFEEAFSQLCGVKHCVGCGNGLDALMFNINIYKCSISSNTCCCSIILFDSSKISKV